MKRLVTAVAVALLFTVGATAAHSEDAAQSAKPKAAAHKKAAKKKSADGCPAGCCEQGKPCPHAAQGGAMPADCPCKKAKEAQQGGTPK